MFREWLERTDDAHEAARRAGVSERTARRWRAGREQGGEQRLRGRGAAGAASAVDAAGAAGLTGAPQASFIGRRGELEALHRVVRAGHRVIALLGMGGIGKTRTALRYGELFGRERFPGGVAVAPLGSAITGDDVSRQVRCALQLELESGQSIGAALAGRGTCLLVLDDLDGCAGAAAPLIAQWSAAAPAATIVMTARVRPGVLGEALFELEAMPAEPDGVDLFVERARLVQPSFAPSAAERRQILDVVRRLDGLPLAIELAAARVGLLGLTELRVRLEAPFEVLTASRSHPSLRASLERSWQVLDEGARRALAECSVFRGGFSLAAAERVLSGPDPSAASSVVERLQTLRDHSLLRISGRGRRGEPRFDLYESIRELAAAKLAGSDPAHVAELHARHTRCFLEPDAASAAGAAGAAGAVAPVAPIAPIDPAELANLRAVQQRALAEPPVSPANAAIALRASIAMHPLLARTGPLEEYQLTLDATLQHADAAGLDPALLARAYAARGRVMRGLGKPDAAVADALRSLSLAALAGDRSGQAQAHRDLGRIATGRGHPAEALGHYEAARAELAACGDRRGEAHVLSLLSDVANGQGRDDDAQACGERAIALFTELGDDESRARARYVEGGLHFRAGRHADARRCWEEAIELLTALGDPRFEGYARCNLGILLYEVARYHSARVHLEAAHQRFARAGYQRLALIVTGYLGTLALRLGHAEPAQASYREAIADRGEVSIGRYYTGVFRAARASALAQLGRAEEAHRELATAAAELEAFGDPKALAALALHRHVVTLALATSRDARAAAEAALAALPPASLISDDVRLARDLLVRALCGTPDAASPHCDAWWICEDGTSFRGPDAPLVDLRARRPLARLLAALAQLHADAPGASLSAEALFDRAWPGERALPEARQNRVNVALVTLRKLGLRPLLVRAASGYQLDPHVAIELGGLLPAPR